MIFTMRVGLWHYPGPGGWHFVTLPGKYSKEIKKAFTATKRGWGSIPVVATIGSTTWKTSLFPDSKSSSYVLPVKAVVRKKEGLEAGMSVRLTLEVH